MKLSDWMAKKWPDSSSADRYRKMAELLRSNHLYIYQIATERRRPSLRLSFKIKEVTGGEVDIAHSRPDLAKALNGNMG
jgi:hypothetical protein